MEIEDDLTKRALDEVSKYIERHLDKCDGDWRACGHCKVRFDGPSFDPARPFCDKAGFWDMLLGNDWCPYAPLADSDEVQKGGEE